MKKKYLLLFPLLLLCSCSSGGLTSNEHVTIKYQIDNETVFIRIIDKGNQLGISYVFDYPTHQTHVSKWLDNSGTEYTKDTIINENITLYGISRTNLQIENNNEEEFVRIKGVNHVHEDGNLVVLDQYFSKPVFIDENALANNEDVKAIYLPRELYHLSSGNFSNCSKLTKIYYEGTMEQFDYLSKDEFTLPSGVLMVYNTSFVTNN